MRKGFTIQLDPNVHRAMKMASCKADKRISHSVEEACRVYLLLAQEAEKQGKSLEELVDAVHSN